MSDLDDWITSREAQAQLARSERAIRRYAQLGQIRSRLGPAGRVQYNRQDVERLAASLRPDERPKAPDTQIMPAGQALQIIQDLQRQITEAAAREGYLRAQLDSRPQLEDHTAIAEQLATERARKEALQEQLAEAQRSRSTWQRLAIIGLALASLALTVVLILALLGRLG